MRYSRIVGLPIIITSLFLSFFLQSLVCSSAELTVPCDVTLKNLSDVSDFIFTAKVDSLSTDLDDFYSGDKVAIIDIKRLIRTKDKVSFENLTEQKKISLKLSSSLFFSDFIVGHELARKIYNCSRKSLYTNVKVRDTRIFCGRIFRESDVPVRVKKFDRNGTNFIREKELLAVSVQLNLQILEYFTFLEDSSYRPRAHIDEEPCERTFCGYGEICEVEKGQAKCKCNTDCPDDENRVCGTDNSFYKNECILRATACKNKSNVKVQHFSECHSDDPCVNHVCPYGARCTPKADGQNVTCECPDNCPNYGDHSKSGFVCGTDGLVYVNHCELERTACTSSTNISIRYEGYCDPCTSTNVECSPSEVCRLDSERNPVCRCSEICQSDLSPVCGSDGKTYRNECILRKESCRSRKNLRVLYSGKCDPDKNPCAHLHCNHYEECVMDKYDNAKCSCPIFDCEPIVRPVCGTDGLTYDSVCHLQESSCRTRTNVTIAYHDICGDKGLCSNYHCDFGGICMSKKGRPQCECPICTDEFEPVCGDDGISYDNLCHLQREICRQKHVIHFSHHGLCNDCGNSKCDYYAVCKSDDGGKSGKCVCPTDCSQEVEEVCGSDGNHYKNKCELEKQACLQRQMITVALEDRCSCVNGNCDENKTLCESGFCDCPTNCDNSYKNEPVCASDQNTYSNECEVQKHACQKGSPLRIVFIGDCSDGKKASPPLEPMRGIDSLETDPNVRSSTPKMEVCQDIICDFEGTCEIGADGKPHCACVFDCSRELEKPVCGSDLQIYPSLCHMKIKSCQRQKEIRIRPIELCQGMQVKPCNGKSPIIDPVTHQELDCGSGPHRRDCPLNTYCHHTSKFARCCPKDSALYFKSCKDSWYGCCPDKKTPAQGPDNAGCPSLCNCNKLGSYSDACDAETNQCKCKPGVGGPKCDRCEAGFWGLPKISSGHPGCLPCGCSLFGSVRDDCEQMTGRCVCKPEIQGPKCTACTDPNKQLGPNGCVSVDVSTPVPSSCDELSCYFNATCEVQNGEAKCICHFTCPQDYHSHYQAVCGNDGQTYSSECQLKLYSCRYQKDIAVQALSSCTDDYLSGTDGPRLGAWTSINQFTESEDVIAPISKSTRHVLSSESRSISYFTPKMPGRTALISHNGDVEYNEVNAGKLRDSYHIIGRPTSATMTVILGDSCTANDDCLVENSHCLDEVCVCQEGYAESPNRMSCSEGITLAVTQRGCSLSPCLNGGRCHDLNVGQYKCVCPTTHTGSHCEIVKDNKQGIDVPAFSGQSFIELKPLKAYHKFSVEIEFKSYTDNGILLYNQQRTDGAGDFISLALVNGYAEFRYNLGNGPAVLTSLQRLATNTYHKIVAKRYQRDGILQVDNGELITGQSEGTLKALDLNDNAYIGYVPISSNKIFENIGTSTGFIGCIRKLKIGRHTVRLKDRHDTSVIKTHDLKECTELVKCENTTDTTCTCLGGICETESNSCSSSPCQHGSFCEPLLQGGYTCNCLPGHKGNSCEIFEPNADDLYMPEFNGVNAYIKFPCLENVRRSFSIDIWFLTTALNGALLYNGQLHNRRGDFIAINLVNGHIQFRYDLGSGLANITSANKVHLGLWQSVKVHRFDRIGSIQVNNGTIVKGMSGPPLNELNLELPLYIGGVPTLSEVSRESGVMDKFSGVIQRILVNGKSLHLMAGEHVNVVPYKSHPCASDQTCLNGGICVPYLTDFLCKCTTSFGGIHCQNYTPSIGNADQELGVQFSGNVFLMYIRDRHSSPDSHNSFTNRTIPSNLSIDGIGDEYESSDVTEDETSENYHIDDMYDDTMDDFDDFFNDEHKNKKTVHYEFSLRTSQTRGLLLWSSKIRHGLRDYIAVALIDGHVEFSHYFGKEQQILSVKSEETISDGFWHTILIQHRKRMTQIRVDSNRPIKLYTDQIQKMFPANGKVFIGGIPTIPADFPEKYMTGFQGCIRKLSIDKKRISLAQLYYNTTIPVEFCEENDI